MSFLESLQFDLPEELIALTPAQKREDARLLVFDRAHGTVEHTQIHEMVRWLKPTDLMVFNQTKVVPARVEWNKPGGGHCEILFLRCQGSNEKSSVWEALVSGKKIYENQTYELPAQMQMKMVSRIERSRSKIEMRASEADVRTWFHQVGKPPIPPYIRQARKRKGLDEDMPSDSERYQTTFATKPGAVAAPTAGLHFSKGLLEEIAKKGVETAFVNLAVGWGTFQPVDETQWKTGKLHEEWVEISKPTTVRLLNQKPNRVIAVGTTTVRALEWWANQKSPKEDIEGWCDLFLQPPWQSKVVNALVTNFHIPGSSLLALVAGFVGEDGIEKIKEIYKEAIAKKYRFYSYGDAMLIV